MRIKLASPFVAFAAVFAASNGEPVFAGPADASCVYLARGCRSPTLHSPFDVLQSPTAEEFVLPDDGAPRRDARVGRRRPTRRHQPPAS